MRALLCAFTGGSDSGISCYNPTLAVHLRMNKLTLTTINAGILASDDVEAPTATNVEMSSTELADNEHKIPEGLVPGGTSEQDADARP